MPRRLSERDKETSRQESETFLVSGKAQSSLAGRWERFHCRDFRKLRKGRASIYAKTQKTRASGFQLSPTNRYLSYVRDNDLYLRDISNPQSVDREIRITADGDEVVSNGLADFIAAEEMHRHVGHWGPKTIKTLFTKVDTSKVQISTRTEINADQTRSLEQRYPYAGEDNADSKLFEYDLDSSVTRELWRNKIDGMTIIFLVFT